MLVRDDLDLDPRCAQSLAGHAGGEDRLARGAAAGGIWQRCDVQAVQQIEDALTVAGAGMAAHGHGGQLGPGGEERALEGLVARGPTGAHDEVGGKGGISDGEHLASLDSGEDFHGCAFSEWGGFPL